MRYFVVLCARRTSRPIVMTEANEIALFLTEQAAEEGADDLVKKYPDSFETFQIYQWPFTETPTWTRAG